MQGDGHQLHPGWQIAEEALHLAILRGAKLWWPSAQRVWDIVQACLGRVVAEADVAPVHRGQEGLQTRVLGVFPPLHQVGRLYDWLVIGQNHCGLGAFVDPMSCLING